MARSGYRAFLFSGFRSAYLLRNSYVLVTVD